MPLLEQVLKKYPEKVKIVFKNFPLRNHKFAWKAAMAALAADRQGKFWEFHDELFKNSKQLNDNKVSEIARQLGLNDIQFKKDMKDPKLRMQISKDMRDGAKIRVRGTPTIFVNGRLLRKRSLEGFRELIEKK